MLRLLHFFAGFVFSIILGCLAQLAMRAEGMDDVACVMFPSLFSFLIIVWFLKMLYGGRLNG